MPSGASSARPQAGCSTASSTQAQPCPLEPRGRLQPGRARHGGLSSACCSSASEVAGQVLACSLSGEGSRGQRHLLPRWNDRGLFSLSSLTYGSVHCLFEAQEGPQLFPIKAHVQLFDEKQRTGSKQPGGGEDKMSSPQDMQRRRAPLCFGHETWPRASRQCEQRGVLVGGCWQGANESQASGLLIKHSHRHIYCVQGGGACWRRRELRHSLRPGGHAGRVGGARARLWAPHCPPSRGGGPGTEQDKLPWLCLAMPTGTGEAAALPLCLPSCPHLLGKAQVPGKALL